MSHPEITLRSISLANFRGAKDPLVLDFGKEGRSCAVFGNNGEGKSTITQAVEWFFTDSIAALRGEGMDEEDMVNVAANADEETAVGLFFNKTDLSATKTFVKARRKSAFDNRKPEFVTYLDGDAKYDRLYLNQYTIANFLLQTKGDKRKQIANIVGFEDIVNVKAIISSMLSELQRSPRFRDLQTRLQYNQGQLTSAIYGDRSG
jgi:predicted ATP-binding protein involved in virulence